MVVQRCYDLTSLLGPLSQSEEELSEVIPLHRPDKALVKSNDGPSFQYSTFYGGRNFR